MSWFERILTALLVILGAVSPSVRNDPATRAAIRIPHRITLTTYDSGYARYFEVEALVRSHDDYNYIADLTVDGMDFNSGYQVTADDAVEVVEDQAQRYIYQENERAIARARDTTKKP